MASPLQDRGSMHGGFGGHHGHSGHGAGHHHGGGTPHHQNIPFSPSPFDDNPTAWQKILRRDWRPLFFTVALFSTMVGWLALERFLHNSDSPSHPFISVKAPEAGTQPGEVQAAPNSVAAALVQASAPAPAPAKAMIPTPHPGPVQQVASQVAPRNEAAQALRALPMSLPQCNRQPTPSAYAPTPYVTAAQPVAMAQPPMYQAPQPQVYGGLPAPVASYVAVPVSTNGGVAVKARMVVTR